MNNHYRIQKIQYTPINSFYTLQYIPPYPSFWIIRTKFLVPLADMTEYTVLSLFTKKRSSNKSVLESNQTRKNFCQWLVFTEYLFRICLKAVQLKSLFMNPQRTHNQKKNHYSVHKFMKTSSLFYSANKFKIVHLHLHYTV